MPFIDEILKYKSLSIVGLEKNTGKTECLNYILRHLPTNQKQVCVTSIGLDGEKTDQVTSTSKPEISIPDGVYFATSEKHYRSRRMLSEIVDISSESTSLGRVITAKSLIEGKVILSGPSSTVSLKRWMDSVSDLGMELTVIDGALSRMSTASPAVSESMILTTGAACSANLPTLLQKTAFAVEMIGLPLFNETEEEIEEVSALASSDFVLKEGCKNLKIQGALTDGFLARLTGEKRCKGLNVIVRDFTRIFVKPLTYRMFQNAGGKLSVLKRSKLIAVCVNPTAPNGFLFDSDSLCKAMYETISIPVYDIVKNRYEA